MDLILTFFVAPKLQFKIKIGVDTDGDILIVIKVKLFPTSGGGLSYCLSLILKNSYHDDNNFDLLLS